MFYFFITLNSFTLSMRREKEKASPFHQHLDTCCCHFLPHFSCYESRCTGFLSWFEISSCPVSSLTFKVLESLYDQFGLYRIHFKNCGSPVKILSAAIHSLFLPSPAVFSPFLPISKDMAVSYITAQSCVCQ